MGYPLFFTFFTLSHTFAILCKILHMLTLQLTIGRSASVSGLCGWKVAQPIVRRHPSSSWSTPSKQIGSSLSCKAVLVIECHLLHDCNGYKNAGTIHEFHLGFDIQVAREFAAQINVCHFAVQNSNHSPTYFNMPRPLQDKGRRDFRWLRRSCQRCQRKERTPMLCHDWDSIVRFADVAHGTSWSQIRCQRTFLFSAGTFFGQLSLAQNVALASTWTQEPKIRDRVRRSLR